MAALVEGCRYGLSSEGTNSSDRTLVFVKLTDSALQAVEEFVKYKNTTSRTASIQFDGNTGTINIPNLRQDSSRTFGFNISSLDKDASLQQGSFDCIGQKTNSEQNELDNLGALQYKMQICANEESYEKTRARMATAEQESKKNCAKVIKITGNDKSAVGRKVKLKRPANTISTTPAAPTSPPFSRNAVSRSNERLERTVEPPVRQERLEERVHLSSMPTLLVASNNVKNTSPAQSLKARASNDIMKRSYRERLIHMLAVRPHKKPEILARLNKEGVKESEKKGMSALLSQITTLKDNTYHLLRSIWQEVHEDEWPFYTPEDKYHVKKNRANLDREEPRHSTLRVSPVLSGPLTPSNPSSVVSSDSGIHSNHSPSSHSEEATTPNHREQNLKRSSPAESFEAQPDSKRPRVSLYSASQKKSPPISPPIAPGRNPPWQTMGSTGSSYCQSSPECASPSSQDCKSNGSSPSSDVPEYVGRYVGITSLEQRLRYKDDFTAEYPRYRELHQVLEKHSQKFIDLEIILRKCDYGSESFRRCAAEIMSQYRKTREDQEYQNARKNFNYLHEKLSYIKQLVAEYDRVHS